MNLDFSTIFCELNRDANLNGCELNREITVIVVVFLCYSCVRLMREISKKIASKILHQIEVRIKIYLFLLELIA